MKKILLWIAAARPQFFTATIIPIALGAAMAWNHMAVFNWGLFWLTLIGGIFIHAGLDYSNDYYDYKTGNDVVNKTPTPFSGGSRFLREGILRPKQVLLASLICFAAGSAIGLYISYLLKTNVILIIGIIGVFLAFFYTGGPIKIGYTRCAETATGLGFGPLMVIGSYYVQARSISWQALWSSVPIGILIALVQYINQFPDYEADKKARKNNTVVTLGKEKAVRYYYIFLILPYCLVILGVILDVFPKLALITLLTAPLAVKAIRVAKAHFNQINELLPANALTIAVHFLFGALFTAAYLLNRLITRGGS
ncbi:MAG: 1,4-dihydroxy-2-naphthoate octaprenyltransferase [Candidatus Omnitrophota bacterium]|nr:1,4-dihydroxy-2-naphthoate octaprenyltransferase [Candidatus Omnitrophota bacterium]